ncbi:hypothetical protein [Sphingomonas bacterium]|uniref:hypothetical protein n=1 Tax=Sphingomonas bacterium TaxID=1895847 RepID=UPI001575D5C7|nr:hypothetical protein [Sphingomonas bacterium]
MSGPREGVDPDIEQAIEDMLPIVPELRQAKAQLDRLGPSGDLNKVAVARAHLGGMRSDITTRAERIGTTLDGLLVILDVEHGLRFQLKRQPARHVVESVLADKLAKRLPRLHSAADAHAVADIAVATAELRARRTKYAGAKDLETARPALAAAKAELAEAERRVNAAREALRAFRGAERTEVA